MDPRIAHVISRMENTLAERVSIDDLAAAVNLSPSRLAHLFAEEIGVPPARYLHDLRMPRARVLLERTFLTVKQVMVCVGVNDPSHFARDFRRSHGISPSALRQRSTAADAPRRRGQVPLRDGSEGQGP